MTCNEIFVCAIVVVSLLVVILGYGVVFNWWMIGKPFIGVGSDERVWFGEWVPDASSVGGLY